ncbi:TPA: hypothetical protein ACH6KT_002391 [Enterococcus faecium]|uniref:hypothetical protein n=1 Tax=Enterococcus TaxID=1350 RepID=UPI00115C6068|nr:MULTISPECIES: hypothetical protein [Enterococcus]
MTFVVKKMCYLDSRGRGEASVEFAKHHTTKEEADLVASVCGGEVVEVIKPERRFSGPKAIPVREEACRPKSNQAWMRGAK